MARICMPALKHTIMLQRSKMAVCLCVHGGGGECGVLTDRCTRSQRWSKVAMATVWAEGAVSILSVQKTRPLRSLRGFKMAVRDI